jgi:RsiW-degrading membrane proteinase PrsW (M82 family)
MPLTCNIDANGKKVRLLMGIAMLVIALVLAIFWSRPSETTGPWVVTLIILLIGTFAMFEARAGWCAVRAMGFKTRL